MCVELRIMGDVRTFEAKLNQLKTENIQAVNNREEERTTQSLIPS